MSRNKMRYDLHVHTNYSIDGSLSPEKVVKIARSRDLQGVAITDHNTIKGGIEAKRYETDSFNVIVGSEIKTNRGDLIGLFLTEEVHSRDLQGASSEIRGQGGLVVIPHPFDRFRSSAINPTEEEVKMVDALEVFNSRCLLMRCNRKALKIARELGTGITAGSDAHFAREIGSAGIITHSDDLKSAIVQGQAEVFGRRSSLLNYNRYLSLRFGHGGEGD
jgi:predicted metal-dependent phosphoesterase TrpH